MINVFLDTNILVSATFWKGTSYKILIEISERKANGFTTKEVLQEYRVVLKRDFNLTEEEVDMRVEKLLEVLTVVSPKERIDTIKEDPTDNKILEGATEANVDFILSYDHDLLDLMAFRGILIIKPEKLLTGL